MKKTLILLLCIVASTCGFAQAFQAADNTSANPAAETNGGHRGHHGRHQGGGSPEKRAEKLTAKLVTALSLNTDQQKKTYDAVLGSVNARKEAKTVYANDKPTMKAKMKGIQSDLENQLKTIFTPAQFTTYLAKKEELMEKMKEHRAGKRGDAVGDQE
jgi:hypothetical protein